MNFYQVSLPDILQKLCNSYVFRVKRSLNFKVNRIRNCSRTLWWVQNIAIKHVTNFSQITYIKLIIIDIVKLIIYVYNLKRKVKYSIKINSFLKRMWQNIILYMQNIWKKYYNSFFLICQNSCNLLFYI